MTNGTEKTKKQWWEDASYVYEATPHNDDYDANEHFITFKFPNAYGGPIEVTELFSKYNSDGTADYRNQIAELLQCYIDRENHG